MAELPRHGQKQGEHDARYSTPHHGRRAARRKGRSGHGRVGVGLCRSGCFDWSNRRHGRSHGGSGSDDRLCDRLHGWDCLLRDGCKNGRGHGFGHTRDEIWVVLPSVGKGIFRGMAHSKDLVVVILCG